MNQHHQQLLKAVRVFPEIRSDDLSNYIGSKKISHKISTAEKKAMVQAWLTQHMSLSLVEYRQLLNSLYRGKTHTEIALAGKILELTPKLRQSVDPANLNQWLENLQGWAEVDSLCQSNFGAKEMLGRWEDWKRLLLSLSKNGNIHKRRASLVLLTKPVCQSNDQRLAQLAFTNIDRLKDERAILVTKAVSWLLRNLIKHHRTRVEAYLQRHQSRLPAIAVRETRQKVAKAVQPEYN
ncbi:DNA alkylation repair protein [Patescibacteria group bacterium]|nr:DNA alkylation repair protein [Patescibacteria group bacterium]MCL5091246.1 DNA alkylation repair protein [Patescibacteria group bacterium]